MSSSIQIKKKGMAFSNSPTAQNFFIQGGSADGRWRTNYYVALIEIDTAERRALIEQIHAAGVPSDVVKYPDKEKRNGLLQFANCTEFFHPGWVGRRSVAN